MKTHLVRPLVSLLVLLAVAALGGLGGCSRGEDSAEKVEAEIARYRREPSDALAARIDASFAQLDADIARIRAEAEQEEGEDRTEHLARAAALEERRDGLRKDYYAARVERAAEAAKSAAKQLGESVGKGLESAGKKIQEAVEPQRPDQ
ncbi:MAG: hypothetical protein AB1689_19960 [Thermodesulfobacteriota bacterium]